MRHHDRSIGAGMLSERRVLNSGRVDRRAYMIASIIDSTERVGIESVVPHIYGTPQPRRFDEQPKLLAVVALCFLNSAVAADLFVTVAPVSELQKRMTTEFPASAEPLETSLCHREYPPKLLLNARPGDRVTVGRHSFDWIAATHAYVMI